MSQPPEQRVAQLVLYPQQPDLACERVQLTGTLKDLGFIGQALGRSDRYLIGENFLSQISFLGCSPAIEFDPATLGDSSALEHVTHIFVSPVFRSPRFVFDPQSARPICTQCGTRIDEWHTQVTGAMLRCPHCHQRAPLEAFRWRRTAGRARLFVSVLNVYPREAIPSDGFLRQLEAATGSPWNYFYCRCSLIV